MKKQSEYGRGLVICLTKFSEHFMNDNANMIHSVVHFEKEYKEGELPDVTRFGYPTLTHIHHFNEVYLKVHGTYEKALSSLIESWANGATDHLYDIKVPKGWKQLSIGKKVQELRNIGLHIGHGFSGQIWTFEDFKNLQQKTRELAILIDKKIGIKNGDLGEW